MKRFHSKLEKFHGLCVQQTRIAQLELTRCKAVLQQLETEYDAACQEESAARDAMDRAMRAKTQSMILRSAQYRLSAIGERIVEIRQRLISVQKEYEEVRRTYQERKSREESLGKLIAQQRQIHRQEMLKEQQWMLDDVATAQWMERTVSGCEGGHHG